MEKPQINNIDDDFYDTSQDELLVNVCRQLENGENPPLIQVNPTNFQLFFSEWQWRMHAIIFIKWINHFRWSWTRKSNSFPEKPCNSEEILWIFKIPAPPVRDHRCRSEQTRPTGGHGHGLWQEHLLSNAATHWEFPCAGCFPADLIDGGPSECA